VEEQKMSTEASKHPQPTPEFAVYFRDFMVERLRQEHATTARVFAALREGDWRPDPKSRSARELAWHIAHSERWFLTSLANRSFVPDDEGKPPATAAAIAEAYDKGFAPSLDALNKLTAEQLLEITDFFGMKMPLFALIDFCYIHMIHHRGQLATYLRPLGGKVPDIYGGSADEPFQG
jgi:uncharacterized damage-inducible protein DinB